jgi:hypothetical protein
MTTLPLLILGVHPVVPSAEMFEATLLWQYGSVLDPAERSAAERAVHEHFATLFLLELRGTDLRARFPWGEITQEAPGAARDTWQAVYDEQPLDPEQTRWACFFHCLDLSRPLLTPLGPMALPGPTPVPAHLQAIVYEAP